MKLARPTPQEERWLELGDRYAALRGPAEARAGGWKKCSTMSRVLMFVLGLMASSMITGSLMFMPGRLLLAGVAMLFLGEWLVRQRRLVGGGIEEALLLCGAVAVIAQLLLWVEPKGDALALLIGSAAVLAVGVRLSNAAFTTLAALGVSLAIACAGQATLFGSRTHSMLALGWCVLTALSALALGAREWLRPSHDRMLDGLVIAMPAAAFGWAIAEWPLPLRLGDAGAGQLASALPALLALGFAFVLAVTGVRRRTHAPLIAALPLVAALASALRELTGLPLYGRLLLWGSLALAFGILVERALRRPREGITSAAIGPRSRLDNLAQLYGAARITPQPPTPTAGFEGQGGGFGGGGASGRF